MEAALGEAIGSILKIFTTSVEPDYTTPWSVYMEEECTGSGFVIRLESGELVIVTNAHVISQAVSVRVRSTKTNCTPPRRASSRRNAA